MIAINKPYYTEYVNHMLRFFVRNMNRVDFRSKVDERNWWACYNVMAGLNDNDYDLVVAVFKERRDSMQAAVVDAANGAGIPASRVWAVLNNTAAKVAREAMLID